jgi:flagellin-like protein
MKFTHRRAISPIIATLLLIAIAVAAGIIVYVYVNSLAGGLTSGGGSQVSQQLQLQAYSFTGVASTSVSSNGVVGEAFLENTGSSSITISSIYFDGTALTQWYATGTPAYEQYFVVPTSGGACFALLPPSTTITAYILGTSQPASGIATACGTEAAATTCATVTCLNTASGQTPTLTLAPLSSVQLLFGLNSAATSGTSHTIKVVTANGGVSVFTVVAGRTG